MQTNKEIMGWPLSEGAVVVWKAWRDMMIAQGRSVPEQRMNLETLPQIDLELDAAIAQEVILAFLAWQNKQEWEKPDGVMLISRERARQNWQEGFSPAHDDRYTRFELSRAAMAYLNSSVNDLIKQFWPWDWKWWKPSPDPIRNLVKAGALICAEIDRLLREKAKK